MSFLFKIIDINMIVKPETFKHLLAINDGKIIRIPNMILRKQVSVDKQEAKLSKNSICIVCNFRFMENKIDWSSKVKAVCHPFKDDGIFPDNIDKYLFSESDFCDKLVTPINTNLYKKKYDFVYFTLNSREGTRSKGIYLLPLLDKVAGELNLKGLVVDYATRETSKFKGTIYDKALKRIKKQMWSFKNFKVMRKKLSSDKVCSIMLSSKFVFVPSDADASPRLITEALVRNVPLVINSSIYGGWKYINDNNGCFFDAPTIHEFIKEKYSKYHEINLKKAINKVLLIDRSKISKNFYRKYGFLNSSVKLAKIINKITGKKYKAVAYDEWKKQLRKVGKNEGWL